MKSFRRRIGLKSLMELMELKKLKQFLVLSKADPKLQK